jgi:hypothetical protein
VAIVAAFAVVVPLRQKGVTMRRVFISDEQDELFERDGAVVVSLLDAEEVATLLDFYQREGAGSELGFHATMFSGDVGYRARVDEVVKSIMTPKLLPYLHEYRAVVGNYVVKERERADSAVPVHQDWTFVDETRMESLNVWCPLIDTTPENGRLHLFKGSHRLLNVVRGPFFPNPYVTNAKVIARSYLSEQPLRAGEAVIYSHALVHASPPNRSAKPRPAANLALVPAEAQMIHAYLDPEDPSGRPEIFSVDDAFFLSNIIGERPEGARSIGFIEPIPNIDAEELSRRCEHRYGALEML